MLAVITVVLVQDDGCTPHAKLSRALRRIEKLFGRLPYHTLPSTRGDDSQCMDHGPVATHLVPAAKARAVAALDRRKRSTEEEGAQAQTPWSCSESCSSA